MLSTAYKTSQKESETKTFLNPCRQSSFTSSSAQKIETRFSLLKLTRSSTRIWPQFLKALKCPALIINGTSDHLHTLFSLSRVATIADVVEEVKTELSKWIKRKELSFETFIGRVAMEPFRSVNRKSRQLSDTSDNRDNTIVE